MERAENRRRPERGGRAARGAGRSRGGVAQRPWKLLERPYPPTEILSADQVESLHRAALRLLSEIGMKVLDGTARARYRAGGAEVDDGTMMVRFDPALLEGLVAQAPERFTLSARNPARDLVVGGRHSIFVAVGGPAYVSDLEKGRRAGSFAEMCDFLKAIQSLNVIHQEGGSPFEPLDLDPETRHLDFYLAAATLMDKSWQGIGLGRARTLDSLEMAARMLGLADRGRVLDLFDMILRGDAASALTELSAQYAEGADPMAVLRDLAEIAHWVSVIKITPEAADDPTVGPDERARGAQMAENLPMRVLTRLWQMLLKALEEVAHAPNAMMAAEMAVIRLTHVADLPSPEELVRRIRETPQSGPGPAPNGGGGGVAAEGGAADPGGGPGGAGRAR